MSIFKITKIAIKLRNCLSKPMEIYFVLRTREDYYSKVCEISGMQLFSQNLNISTRLPQFREIVLEIWKYQPNIKISEEKINGDHIRKNRKYSFLMSDTFLVTIQREMETDNVLTHIEYKTPFQNEFKWRNAVLNLNPKARKQLEYYGLGNSKKTSYNTLNNEKSRESVREQSSVLSTQLPFNPFLENSYFESRERVNSKLCRLIERPNWPTFKSQFLSQKYQ